MSKIAHIAPFPTSNRPLVSWLSMCGIDCSDYNKDKILCATIQTYIKCNAYYIRR